MNFLETYYSYRTPVLSGRQEKRGSSGCRGSEKALLFTEGHTVGTLFLGGAAFVGTHADLIQRTVVLVLTVMGTLADGTFDALVCMIVHYGASFFCWVLH